MGEEMKRKVEVQGNCIGVDFSKRGKNDNHVLINIYIEDDEMWHKSISLSSYWIDDFIDVLTKAKEKMESDFDKKENGFGYQYTE